MRRMLVTLVLVGCRPQAGGAPAPVEVTPSAASTVSEPEPPPAGPPGDRDGDGVLDASDGCPDEPEDLDQFEDEDGCVDRDNDNDKVPDVFEFKDGRWTNCDRKVELGVELDCRNRPEDFDGVDDHDGCPDVMCLDSCSPRKLATVHLDRGGELDTRAAGALKAAAETLIAAPWVELHVEAHTEARRDDAAAKRLTQRLAAEVLDELVRLGVARERMEPIGWGGTKPIDRNSTAEGRANNRRVELVLKYLPCCRDPLLTPPVADPREPECR